MFIRMLLTLALCSFAPLAARAEDSNRVAASVGFLTGPLEFENVLVASLEATRRIDAVDVGVTVSAPVDLQGGLDVGYSLQALVRASHAFGPARAFADVGVGVTRIAVSNADFWLTGGPGASAGSSIGVRVGSGRVSAEAAASLLAVFGHGARFADELGQAAEAPGLRLYKGLRLGLGVAF